MIITARQAVEVIPPSRVRVTLDIRNCMRRQTRKPHASHTWHQRPGMGNCVYCPGWGAGAR